MASGVCDFDGCQLPRAVDSLCAGHAKQLSQGKRLSPLRDSSRTPFDLLVDAAQRYLDADTDVEFERARSLLRKQAVAFAVRLQRIDPVEFRAHLGIQIGRPPKVTREAIALAMMEPSSRRELAARLGVSLTTIKRIVKNSRAKTSGPGLSLGDPDEGRQNRPGKI